MDRDTITPESGKRYETRSAGIVGPMRIGVSGMEDHFTDGSHWWHSAGDCCGDADFDLIREV